MFCTDRGLMMADAPARESGDNAGTKSAAPFNAAEIFEQAAPSVVQMNSYFLGFRRPAGTGFFVSSGDPNSCEVATAGHVTDREKTYITTRDGKQYDAVAELIDKEHEISIFKVTGVEDPQKTCKPFRLDTAAPIAGEPVLAIGAAADPGLLGFGSDPESRDLSVQHPGFKVGTILGEGKRSDPWDTMKEHPFIESLTKLMHGSPKGDSLNSPMIKATVIGAPGYSGGPWVDKDGAAIGMTFAIFNAFNQKYELGEQMKFLQEDLNIIHAKNAKAETDH